MRRTGLTLIEVLVALLVMAAMALMSRLVIDGMLRSQAVAQERGANLNSLQIALAQWSRDLDRLSTTPYVNALQWDGQVLRLLRRSSNEDALVVVAWSARSGQWQRWQSSPLSERSALLRSWALAQRPENADPAELSRAKLLPIGQWQLQVWAQGQWRDAPIQDDRLMDLPAGLRLQLRGLQGVGGAGLWQVDWVRGAAP
jgi:general secretion pathway protein J